MKGSERLIVALDTDSFDKAKDLIDKLDEVVDIFKVGLEQYLSSKGKIVKYLNDKGKKVFLDLKFHDIPNTMKAAVREATKDNVWMMTIHVSDVEGMKQVAKVAKEQAEELNIKKPIIVAVTVLTSINEKDLKDIGCNLSIEETVVKRAKLAKESGIDGVVCSAQEASHIAKCCGKDFVTVCPGIRPLTSDIGDQKRVVSPAIAIQNGAHYLVVGRPITQSENPKESALNIIKEIENAWGVKYES
ncbi:MAG TPA: orotidine-5'-phosphate decarboxylase [Peptostreptococcaceae bacterium]|nr:orotidine-5'-phosphate decarboxylase [Peptostreptococcaceae bacterium]